MNLKKLTVFREENITPDKDGRKPGMDTLKRWPGVCKMGGEYWVDLDVIYMKFQETEAANDLLDTIMDDPKVASIVGN